MVFDKGNLLGFIDVASGMVRVMIVSVNKEGKFCFEGKGEVESVGYKGGKILDFRAFSKSVNSALEMAEKQVGRNVSDVVISLSDFKYKSYFLSSKLDFPFEKKISVRDVQRCSSLIPIHQHINIDKEVLVHVVPMKYVIDGNNVVDNPNDKFAKNLSIRYHVITVDAEMYSSLISVFSSLNLNVVKVVANAYASGLAVLIDDDKKIGSLVLDIGKSTMSVAVFHNDRLVYNYSLPLGGDAITNSLSKHMNVRFSEAERLKQKYGAKAPVSLDFSDYINIFVIGKSGEDEAYEVLKSDFLTMSNNIVKGLVAILRKCLDDKDVLQYINRIVLTGGGAKLLGLKDIIMEVFNCPVRVAGPVNQFDFFEEFDDVKYATLIGLFMFYKLKDAGDYVPVSLNENEHKNLFNKFMKFLMENFG